MRLHRHMLARISSVLLLAGAFVVMSAARADATLILYICNDPLCAGAGDFTIADEGPFDGDLGTPGSIDFTIAGVANLGASSYPAQGSAAEPVLTLNYILSAAAFASFGQPYIFATQDGFTSSGLAQFEADASNGAGLASLYTGPGAFVPPFGPAAFVCAMDCTGGAVVVSPYHLAVGVAPTVGFGGSASGDVTVIVPQQSVPDGGSTAALLGSVLLGFGMLRRRFKQ